MKTEKIIKIAHETVRLTWINDSPEDLIAFAEAVIGARLAEDDEEPVAWLRNNSFRFLEGIEPQDDSELPLYRRPQPSGYVSYAESVLSKCQKEVV